MSLIKSHHRNNAGGGGSSSSTSSMALFSSLFFIILLLLVGISLSISIGLGVFTLWLHPADPTMNNNNDYSSRQLNHPMEQLGQQQQQASAKRLVPINKNIAMSDAATYNNNTLLFHSNFSTVEQRRELEQLASSYNGEAEFFKFLNSMYMSDLLEEIQYYTAGF